MKSLFCAFLLSLIWTSAGAEISSLSSLFSDMTSTEEEPATTKPVEIDPEKFFVMQEQLNQLQKEMQQLRGTIEGQHHQIVTLEKQQAAMYLDVEQQLGQRTEDIGALKKHQKSLFIAAEQRLQDSIRVSLEAVLLAEPDSDDELEAVVVDDSDVDNGSEVVVATEAAVSESSSSLPEKTAPIAATVTTIVNSEVAPVSESTAAVTEAIPASEPSNSVSEKTATIAETTTTELPDTESTDLANNDEAINTETVIAQGEIPDSVEVDNTESKIPAELIEAIEPAYPTVNNRPIYKRPILAEKQDYQQAYEMLRTGGTTQSIALFEQFLLAYPRGTFADSANYWLAETYKLNRQIDKAKLTFENLITQFPNSPKTPDAKLKLGFIEAELNNLGQARRILNDLTIKYPGSSLAELAEKKLAEINQY